jgi:hypothetical protein
VIRKDTADVLKSKILVWGDYPESARWALSTIICILIRERQRKNYTQRQKREGIVTMEADVGGMQQQGSQKMLEGTGT